ncbi:MAG: bifunctional acetate--CoA ligase family protein/GNAT family N-acetyltransferase [Hyphomicrobiales bacterium]|nr:bifunctional acetate--CoA ligase family protein/GNAT family N-acetyltransferase [Hyphomicrobiales bacterium]
MGSHRLETLFNPRSIAVLGASENAKSVGGRVFRNLSGGDFDGQVIPVNPKYEEVGGRKCYPSVADVEGAIDLAVIATPAKVVPEIINQCGARRVGAALVLSAGFGEIGAAGKAVEKRLLDAARRAELPLVGPNCLGIMRPGIGLNATFLDTSAPPGPLALVSQSGALCTAIVDWATPHHLGFSTIVSLGNAVDTGFGDILDYLAGDAKSDAILLYVEGINDARAFMSGLRIAARSKPVIVLKAGRHDAGSKAASTHTGAMIGADDVFDAALERAGVVRAMTFGQLFAAAEILSQRRRARGNRLAIVTNGGGAGVLAADRAGDLGVAFASLEPQTIAKLDGLLPPYWSHGNPIDVLGDAGPDVYGAAVQACLTDKTVDGVLAMLTPQAMTDPESVALSLTAAAETHRTKPILACFMGEVRVARAREMISRKGIPDFTTPERAVEAFSYLADFRRNQELLLQTPGPISDDRKMPDVEGARLVIEAVLSQGRTMLSDTESKAILSAFDIRCNPTREAETAAEALVVAETFGFPVAMKISSPDISHKSDVGGVHINIMGAADIRPAYDAMMAEVATARPDATLRGVTIEPMAKSSDPRSLLVGVKNDPVFGPVVSFGAGGTMTELLRDNAVALPPLNRVLAARLINRTRISQALDGFRNQKPVNRQAIEDVLLRISDMVCEIPHIQELDINPLFVDSDGAIAVDVRIEVRRPPTTPEPYAHMGIHPYPSKLVQKTQLPDGTELIIRPIRPEDAELEQAFVRGLSPEAKYYRFMQSIEELTPEMLVRFTQIDYSREMALIAVVREGGKDRQVGVARYTIKPDGRSCEFAIVVDDDRRKQGIGSRLMKGLMEAARGRGLRSIEGEILAENHTMLKLMDSLGFSLRSDPDDQSLRLAERWL